MEIRKGGKKGGAEPAGAIAAEPAESSMFRMAQVVVGALAAAVLIGSVWLVPRPIGDMYVALAGGRDALAGKLGTPDTWSFMNIDPATGRNQVWINQNWGTHVVYYLTYCVWQRECCCSRR